MKSILLLGLGAIGSLVASKFADDHVKMDILLDDTRYEQYLKEPYYVNGKKYAFNYVTHKTANKPYDFVIVATKFTSLKESIELLDGLMSEDCTIMSLLNGLSSEEVIGRRFGIEHCVYAFITNTDAVRVGRNNNFTADGKIYFGEKDGSTSQRTQDIAQLFDSVGMRYSLTHDIITKQWKKFMVNIGMNQVSAVLNVTYGDFLKSPEIMNLTSDAMDEVIRVGQAMGIKIDESDRDRVLNSFSSLSPDGKTSMLQDVEAKRKTEIDIFAKTLIDLGQKVNIQTPVNKVLYQQIKAIESLY